MLTHEFEERGIDRRPDRVHARPGLEVERLAGRPELAHVLDRHDHLQVELLRNTRVDELDRAAPADKAADLLQRPLGRGEPDALDRPIADEPLQPFEREREMRAALCAGDGMHLVDESPCRPSAATRARDVSIRKSDSGVVIRMSGATRSIAARSFCGVSPVRHCDAQLDSRRKRPAQVALDVVVRRFSGET